MDVKERLEVYKSQHETQRRLSPLKSTSSGRIKLKFTPKCEKLDNILEQLDKLEKSTNKQKA